MWTAREWCATAPSVTRLVASIAHSGPETLAVQDLLRLVVRRARNLVAADIAWVTILDEDSGLFRTICAEGNLTPSTAEMTSHVDMGAVSVIMK